MTTKIIGIKKFRENITKLWKMARKENIRYIVMYHSKPILEVNPVNDDELSIEHFAEEIKTARKQVKNKEVYSQDKIMKEFGMN